MEELAEAGTKFAVEAGAADLEGIVETLEGSS
jgi:hypothetical protein